MSWLPGPATLGSKKYCPEVPVTVMPEYAPPVGLPPESKVGP